MKTKILILILMVLSLLASCAKQIVPAPVAKIEEKTVVEENEAPSELFSAINTFKNQSEFDSLKATYLANALSKLDLQKIDLQRSFILKGAPFEKTLKGRGYECQFEVRQDQIVTFSKATVSKIFVTQLTKTIKGTPMDYCLSLGDSLNDGYALVFKRPTIEQFISQLKETFNLRTRDFLTDLGEVNPESFRIGMVENQESLLIKVLDDKKTRVNLFSINLDSTNPETIFNSKEALSVEEINLNELPENIVINVYKFNLFYAANFTKDDVGEDFNVTSSVLGEYLQEQKL